MCGVWGLLERHLVFLALPCMRLEVRIDVEHRVLRAPRWRLRRTAWHGCPTTAHSVRYGLWVPRQPRPAREHRAIRLSPDALERVAELADEETEGNVSAMLRKLLSEALKARDARKGQR